MAGSANAMQYLFDALAFGEKAKKFWEKVEPRAIRGKYMAGSIQNPCNFRRRRKLVNRFLALFCAAAVAASSASSLRAATIFWQGGSGNLISANYNNGSTSNLTPTSGDVVNFGMTGSATHSVAGTLNLQKLRVGHNAAPGGTGSGNVTISNGAVVNLTVGASGAANASLWVGNAQNGTLNIDGANTSVTAARLIVIGYGNNLNRSGTVNITNGATLTATLGNINLGDSTDSTQGIPGILNVDGNVSIPSAGSDLLVGAFQAPSTVTQTSGLISVADRIEVGSVASNGSSFSTSGGTTSIGGSFFVGLGTSTNAAVNISGTGIITTQSRFLVGGGTSTGNLVTQSGGTLNTTLDVRVGDVTTGTSTYNLSAGAINSTTGMIVGRQGTGKFIQTGGQAILSGPLAIGNRESTTNANSGLYEISAGSVSATALNIAPAGVGEFRVVGDDGAVSINGNFAASNTANGAATLTYKLESGDSLSLVSVTGTATFAAGTALVLDSSTAAPTQTVYDLLTATSITDSGLVFTGPVGWSYRIVSGGNGQILQAFIPEPGTIVLSIIGCAAVLLGRRRVV